MPSVEGISFLDQIKVGEISNPNNPGENLVSITSTADGDFDAVNLFTDPLRHVWRSTDTLTQEIIIKTTTAITIDTFAIMGHNFSELAVVTLEANTFNDFTSPPISIGIPVTPKNMVLTENLGFDMQYYKLTIVDPGNPCGYIEIGRIAGGISNIFLGGKENITDAFTVTLDDKSQSLTNEGFSRPSNSKILIRRLNGIISKMETKDGKDNSNYLKLLDVVCNVKTNRPFVFILDRGDPTLFLGWMEFTTLPTFSFTVNELTNATLSMEEVF